VSRRQDGEYVFGVKAQERGDRGWGERIRSQDNSAEYRADNVVILWVVVTESVLKN
jgi:hypothetical protein